MENKKIAFLTTDLLGERSYSINYHLLLSIRNLLFIMEDEQLTIFTCNINSKVQRSFIEIIAENDIDIPFNRLECKSLDYKDYNSNGQILSQYDVLFTEMYVWCDTISIAKDLNPALKVVTWIHSLLRQEYICNRHAKWIEYDLYVNMQERLIMLSDRVVFDSNYDKDLAMRFYNMGDKFVTIYPVPNQANLSHRNYVKENKTTIRLMYAGRWEYRKGIENLVPAIFKCFTEKGMTLTILSDANFLSNYKDLFVSPVVLRMFECLMEKGTIKIIPWKNSRADYIEYMKDNADIVVIPSLYDPFNIVVYDCINNAIPVVVSNFCGVTELLNDDMLVERINPYDAESIVEGINRIMTKMKYHQESTQFLYNNDNAKNDLVKLYQQL